MTERDVVVASVWDAPPEGWDARVVDAPGGNVHQGTAWAAHRSGQGWTTRFVELSDGRAALVLTRRRPPMPGLLAYAPRGPVAAGDPPEAVAGRAVALADWLRREGAVVFAADPELAASEAYEARVRARGFHPTEELQAERHRMVLRWRPGASAEEVLASVAKTTRQRIRAAERSGTVVGTATDDASLERFADLYTATARRLSFWIGEVGATATWWRRVIDAGQARLLVGRHDDRLVGGLLLYRQGGRWATAYSADDAATRHELPGTMHLLRWTAIRDAVDAGDASIDLGGVDVPGARRVPEPGEPTYGLYEHKRSFGAEWMECEAAHEVVLRPLVHAAAEVARRLRGPRPRRSPPP